MGFRRVASLAGLAPATPTRVEVDGQPVCLVRIGDVVKAIHDTCSHREWSLAEGMVWGNTVECDLHGSCFDLDTGIPTSLPATEPIPVFPVSIVGDDVHVDVSLVLNGAAIPDHR